MQARHALGIDTLDAPLAATVADRAGLSLARWRALEGGAEDMTAYEVSALADALGSDLPSLTGSVAADSPGEGYARFRSNDAVGPLAPADRLLFIQAARLSRWAGDCAQALGRNLPAFQTAPVAPGPTPWRDGYARGKAARRAFERRGFFDPGPVDHLVERLASMGVHVASAPISDANIRGAVVHSPGGLPIILVRATPRSHHRSLRSVVAHELCHLLHDGTKQSFRDSVSRRSERGASVEQRANGFAPSFLAPKDQVDDDPSVDPLALAQRLTASWGFSNEGAAWHVRNLRQLSEAEARQTRRSLPALLPIASGLRLQFRCQHREAEQVAGTMARGLIADLAFEAYQAGHITQRRFVEIAAFA